ncbi:MAG: DMT family transporter [Geminicoccaceae bacterium]|nr:DMT family transporter [Geminicoccaceae bacterium]MCS7268121.1 DMT family transporter [Geminicoccaceae bacterium]MCX7630475.1 DMT family transporter [Geminicoccaceae bacterium]MDW8125045.1 DMT family transporter [Geminicoccaceae bacterium]MDW8342043.1 DMT family transporter [Geminicoccaceae bacterium]
MRGSERLSARPLAAPSELAGIGLAVAAMACFGAMDALSKLLVTDYPVPLVLWLRHLLALPLALLTLGPAVVRSGWRSARPGLQVARAALLVTEIGIVFFCFRALPLADVHAVLAVTPLVVTALSVPLLGERVGWRRWAAVAVGFLGVLVIIRPGLSVVHPASLLAVLAATMYALYNVLTRMVGTLDPPHTSFLWQSVVSAALLSLIGPFFWTPLAPRAWAQLLGLAALGASGHYLLVRALAHAPAVVIQPFSYTMLVWAVVMGYLVFGDFPDLWTITGALVVVAAGCYAAWREYVRSGKGAVAAASGEEAK